LSVSDRILQIQAIILVAAISRQLVPAGLCHQGANDYVTKPFRFTVLLAKLGANACQEAAALFLLSKKSKAEEVSGWPCLMAAK
jgi:DNA-binding response OmpR family regulator